MTPEVCSAELTLLPLCYRKREIRGVPAVLTWPPLWFDLLVVSIKWLNVSIKQSILVTDGYWLHGILHDHYCCINFSLDYLSFLYFHTQLKSLSLFFGIILNLIHTNTCYSYSFNLKKKRPLQINLGYKLSYNHDCETCALFLWWSFWIWK